MTGLLNAIALGAALSVLSAGLGYVICRAFEARIQNASTSLWRAARLAAVLPVLIAPLLYFMPEFSLAAGGSDAGFDLQETGAVAPLVETIAPANQSTLAWIDSAALGLILKLGYAIGLGLVAIAALRRGLWMRALMHETRSASNDERGIFDQLIHHLDIRPPEFRVTPRSTSPFLTGWMPRIVAPETLFDDPDATRFALAHELTHLRRGDERDRIIGSVLVSVFWFNLPLRWIEKALNDAREIACDAESLQALGSAERKPYAAALISMMRSTASPVSAFGSEDRRHREMRIKAILAGKAAGRPSKALLAITVAAAFIPVACAQTAFTERAAVVEEMTLHTVRERIVHLDGEVHEDIEFGQDHEQIHSHGDEVHDSEHNVWFSDGESDPDMNVMRFSVHTEVEHVDGEIRVNVDHENNVVFVGDVDEVEVLEDQLVLRTVSVETAEDGTSTQTIDVIVGPDARWVTEDGVVTELLFTGEGHEGETVTLMEIVSEPSHPIEPDVERVQPVEPIAPVVDEYVDIPVEPVEPAAPMNDNGEKSETLSRPITAPQFSHTAATGRISSRYGPRPGQPAGSPTFHYGTDIAARSGTPIQAVGEGVVSHAAMGLNGNAGWGNTIVLDHGDGWQTVYAHMEGFDVELGDIVSAGDQIGRIGTTGRSTGPHVHVELRHNGERVNPASRLPGLD
jgi:beta-lactamase regulating signal transducer with metallopeptidase domain